MRAFGFISLLLTLGIIGWLMMDQQKTGDGDINAATAKKAEEMATKMVMKDRIAMVQKAVETYKTDKEKLPASLQDLVAGDYLNQVPNGVNYNAETGEVTAAPAP